MENDKLYMTLSNCCLWLRAILFQGKRLFEAHRNFLYYFDSSRNCPIEDWIEVKKKIDYWNGILQIEEYYFTLTTNKARLWLMRSSKCNTVFTKELRKESKKLNEIVPRIREIRNMREHDDQYLYGKGDKQEDFIHKVNNDQSIFVDGSSTLIIEGKYLIGGRLEVKEVMRIAKQILVKVERAFNNYLDHRREKEKINT